MDSNKDQTAVVGMDSEEYQFKEFGEVALSAGDKRGDDGEEVKAFGYQLPEDDDGIGSTAQTKLLSDGEPSGSDVGGTPAAAAGGDATGPGSKFWTFQYYQDMFDVDTRQVLGRILGSAFPRPGVNYLQTNIRPKPDLYGPVWISLTLVFVIAIGGNVVNYFQYEGAHGWHYNFNKVSMSASVILVYAFLVPCLIYLLLWWKGNPANLTLLETVCVYGYSLSIFVPISMLWLIQFDWLQWTLVLTGTLLSGSVLVLTFYPAVSHIDKKIAVLIVLLMVILHGAVACGFMMYFFHAAPKVPGATTTQPATSPSPATTLSSPSPT